MDGGGPSNGEEELDLYGEDDSKNHPTVLDLESAH